jgi:diphosphomevalonate decarboxylase
LIEEEAISMHSVMMTQKPPLYFWSERTIDIIKKIIGGRSQGLEMYFTIDAGENIHLICQSKNKEKIYQYFSKEKNILNIISNQAAIGTRDYE